MPLVFLHSKMSQKKFIYDFQSSYCFPQFAIRSSTSTLANLLHSVRWCFAFSFIISELQLNVDVTRAMQYLARKILRVFNPLIGSPVCQSLIFCPLYVSMCLIKYIALSVLLVDDFHGICKCSIFSSLTAFPSSIFQQ